MKGTTSGLQDLAAEVSDKASDAAESVKDLVEDGAKTAKRAQRKVAKKSAKAQQKLTKKSDKAAKKIKQVKIDKKTRKAIERTEAALAHFTARTGETLAPVIEDARDQLARSRRSAAAIKTSSRAKAKAARIEAHEQLMAAAAGIAEAKAAAKQEAKATGRKGRKASKKAARALAAEAPDLKSNGAQKKRRKWPLLLALAGAGAVVVRKMKADEGVVWQQPAPRPTPSEVPDTSTATDESTDVSSDSPRTEEGGRHSRPDED
ncbi:MAG: hypothetical protein ACK5MR_01080 [Cumulibacter sp.]